MVGSEAMPDPDEVTDLAEFIAALGRLRLWAGSPSYRTLAGRVGPLLPVPQTVSASTVIDVFKSHRRRLDFDLVAAIVRALGVDKATAERWRAACVRVHAEAKTGGPAGVFRQLPADLATFTGRENTLKLLIDAATAGGDGTNANKANTVVVSAIEGMAGVGKTQLAVHLAHQLVRAGRFAEAQLYVDLRGFDPERAPVDPADVLDGFLRALEVPGQHIPAALDERAAMFRDRIHGRDALILLDNAADESQVRPLIPAGPNCLVLITSRRSLAGLDGASLHVLDTFSEAEAVELLAAVVGRERIAAEPEHAARVAELCGYLPLAVALAAARLRSRPTWTVADLATRLAEGALCAVTVRGRSLRPVFDLSYVGLSDPARRMFRLLGLHPGGDFSAEAAAALAGVEPATARELLEQLQDEHMLEEKSRGRYTLHDLLRAYASSRAADQPGEREDALRRLLGFYLHSADNGDHFFTPIVRPLHAVIPPGCRPLEFADADQALAWCDAEIANLSAAIGLAAATGDPVAWQLPVVLSTYFLMRARAEDWVAALGVGVDSARAAGEREGEAAALDRLGIALAEAGRHAEAAATLNQALALNRGLGDRLGQTVNLTNLAVVYELLGRLDDAADCLQQALVEKRHLGNRVGEPVTLANIGKVNFRMGRYEEAIDHCEQAIEIYRETGQDHPAAIALNTIGEALRELGRLTEAERCHRQALDESRRLGVRRVEASSLFQLGKVLRLLDRRAAAMESLRQAHAVYTELADPLADEVEAAIQQPDL